MKIHTLERIKVVHRVQLRRALVMMNVWANEQFDRALHFYPSLESDCVFQQGAWWPCQPVHEDRDTAAFNKQWEGHYQGQ